MKIYIGPYVSYYSIYRIVKLLSKLGVSEETCENISDRLEQSFIQDILNWWYTKQQRKIKIKIDPYDTWNMDSTLALIIHPMLIQLKNTTHGAPDVDNEDVPVELHSHNKDPYTVDDKYFDRWNYVLDEMIWSFGKITESDYDKSTEVFRIKNGLRLFGKYYLGLWD